MRNVKAARAELERRGWIIGRIMPQTLLNRLGYAFIVNLASPESSLKHARRSPPLGASIRRQSPPPKRNMKLLEGSKNQKPASRRPPGASTWNVLSPKPCLTNVVELDLDDAARLKLLYEQAVARGLVCRTRAELLNFFGAAEHARAIGTTNPCGLFATLIRKRLWSFITQRDEENSRRRLAELEERAIFGGRGTANAAPRASRVVPDPHEDAQTICAMIRRSLASVSDAPY